MPNWQFLSVVSQKAKEYAGPWNHCESHWPFQGLSQDSFAPSMSVRPQPLTLMVFPEGPHPPTFLSWRVHSWEARELKHHWTPYLSQTGSVSLPPKKDTGILICEGNGAAFNNDWCGSQWLINMRIFPGSLAKPFLVGLPLWIYRNQITVGCKELAGHFKSRHTFTQTVVFICSVGEPLGEGSFWLLEKNIAYF